MAGGFLTPRWTARRWRWVAAVLSLPAAIALASWWFTEPLDDPAAVPEFAAPETPRVAAGTEPAPEAIGKKPPAWPEARLLVPRLAVAPDHPLALADSRHAVTEAGLAKLAGRLIHFRKLDLADPEAQTVLDTITDARGRRRFRSVHTHPTYHEDRPFAR